jgi:Rps23 Pro-64 3,4-dihydroxylase Tpa1-like proline 4-hydroxylase
MILSTNDSRYGFFGPEAANAGLQFHDQYSSAKPFPHIVLDNFLGEEILDRCLCEFPSRSSSHAAYDRAQEKGKYEFKPETLSAPLRSLFYSFNSAPFILFLENLTGIRGLVPDPYFSGGGFHEVVSGGHLDIHADFNHQQVLNLERRLNVLIYLNRDWREEYGGCLEMWDLAMRSCVVRNLQYVGDFFSR